MIIVMNDTLVDTVCNITDPDGTTCDLSNYNPLATTVSIRRRRRRRRMLNGDYSYKYDGSKIDDGCHKSM